MRDLGVRARCDVEVTADPDTPVSTVLDALPLAVRGRRCYVGQDYLDPAVTVGESVLVHGAIVTIGEPGPEQRGLRDGAVGGLRVLSGEDAGYVAWLEPGRHVMGRDTAARLHLECEEASREHAAIRVAADGSASVEDLGSTNGTFVDRKRVERRTRLPPGSVLMVGSDTIEWVPFRSAPLDVERSPDARLDFDRTFVSAQEVVPVQVDLPKPPARPTTNRGAAWVTALLPVVSGVVLALVLQKPLILLMCLLGPVSFVGTRFAEKKQRAADASRYDGEKVEVRAKVATLLAREEALLRARYPDALELGLAATGRNRRVWARNADSPDGLALRIGVADAPASIDVRGEPWPEFEPPEVMGVPLTIDLREAGVLGVVGASDPTRHLVRWLLVQLGVLRSPDDLRIVLITAGNEDTFAWASWLPHLEAGGSGEMPCWIGNTDQTRAARVGELRDLVTVRNAERRHARNVRFAEDVVVVLDGALSLRNLPGMKAVLRDGPEAGVFVIAVDQHAMNECRAECRVAENGAVRLVRQRGLPAQLGQSTGTDARYAERLARAVAPLRDRLSLGGTEMAIPYPVRFLDLLGVVVPTEDDVLTLWERESGPTTRVPLGVDADGTVHVDLAQQGPHTMLGGATGAGKSILLQTLVTSLLLANSPDELNLVLVDFKGGSAFLPFESCPHVVSLIRSTGETAADVFDEAAAKRVLASVRAEVRRRESLLARYGGEIDEYWRARRASPTLGPLPRLVMIFDEFARVLETSPDFLRELVNVAAKGRSLGMHLVLATQSLQGKLSAELKNNIDLRITLRQNEAADSLEVLGVPDAATIPGRLRGRGMILCTKDETRTPRPFQSGYLGDPPPVGGARPASVRIVNWPSLGVAPPEERRDHGGADTDQTLVVRAVEAAGRRRGREAPFRPLLAPLPARLDLAALARRATMPPAGSAVPFGLLDDPDGQAQPPAVLDLAGTDRLLVAGGPQSGRTTLVRTLLTSVALHFDADQVHVYVIEHTPDGLADYGDLPHCGGVVPGGDQERVRRLVTWLQAEVARRRLTRSTTGRSGGFGDGGPAQPWLVLVVDGWEQFENRADPTFVETSMVTALRDLVVSGPPVGVHVVPVGGQDLVSSKIATLFTQRLMLPFGKAELRRAQLPQGSAAPPDLPGRAADGATGAHVHVCQPGVTPDDLEARALAQATQPGRRRVSPERLPRQFPPLPERIGVAELALADPAPSPTWIPLGVGGPDVAAVGVDLFGAGPHQLLVSGPPGSGRTTAAATVVRGLRAVGVEVLVLAPPRSPLVGLVGDQPGVRLVTGTVVSDSDLRTAAEGFGESRYAVVVDDCDHLTIVPSVVNFAEAPTLLMEAASPSALGHQAIVLCGDAAPIVTGQRRSLIRVVSEILTSGTRLLLTPTSSLVAREQGFKLDADQYFAGPRGRGHLATGRETTAVQVIV